jgi:hypothetical protein
MNTPDINAKAAPLPLNERWPAVLRYAWQGGPLSTCMALAAAHLVVYLPLGWVLDLAVWAALFKYAFEVLRWSANGRADAPEIAFSVGDEIARYAVLLLVIAEIGIMLLSMFYGPFAGLAAGLVLMLGMPAMMVILALEEGLARALNPLAWLMLAERIGRTYFVLVAFFAATVIVQSVLAAGLASFMPGFVHGPLTMFAVCYLTITNFHLIGSVIHAHAEELGYAGHLQINEEVPHTDPARKILDAARTRAASGDARGAAQLLRDEIAANPDSIMLHDEYRHWLQQDDAKSELAAHGKTYIPLLLARNQERRALEVARECQVAVPAFALDNPDDITRLAHAAAHASQTQLTLGLLAGFHKRFRNHPDIGRNYLLAAKLWAERMNKEMQARAMLQQIKIMLPNDPIVPEVDAYLAYLDKLAATPAKSTSP